LGVLLTLFQPEGANYAHHITDSTPGFENLKTALILMYLKAYIFENMEMYITY
jgi:hypothetical protein